MAAKRITQRIPNSQRKRPQVKLTLDPEAHRILKEMKGDASDHVSRLVIRDWKKRGRHSLTTTTAKKDAP